jgi:hypothetical protein
MIMNQIKLLFFVLLLCVSFHSYSQDTIRLQNNQIVVGEVQKFKLYNLVILNNSSMLKIKYVEIQSIKLGNLTPFLKIISLTPDAIPLVINYNEEVQNKKKGNKYELINSEFPDAMRLQETTSEFYLNKAGNRFMASGICILAGGLLTSVNLLIPSNKENYHKKFLLDVASGALYLSSTITLISGGVNLKRASHAKSAKLSYKLSPLGGTLALQF